MERTDVAIISSRPITKGRRYRLSFDPGLGHPDRTQILSRMERMLGEEVFSTCHIPSSDIKIGSCSIEMSVQSGRTLPERIKYSNIRNLRSILDDECETILINVGDKIRFTTGVAQYDGVVSVVAENATDRHKVLGSDNKTYGVSPKAVMAVFNEDLGLVSSPEDLVHKQLFGN